MIRLFSILTLIFAVYSCNKDEIKPRKYNAENLAGNYTIQSFTSNHHEYTISDIDINTITYFSNGIGSIGETWYVSGTSGFTTIQTIESSIATMNFNTDGTWEMTMDYLFTPDGSPFPYLAKKKQSGTWSFINKTSDDYKKNQRILISTLYDRYWEEGTEEFDGYYSEGQRSSIFVINKLSKTELDLSGELTNKGAGVFFPLFYQTDYDPYQSLETIEMSLSK